jgi:2',3'-cyclic-nucleotide 2'-phosphodiesterase (5'-nucleotidase family)
VNGCLITQAGPQGSSVAVVHLKLGDGVDGTHVTEKTAGLVTTDRVPPSEDILDLVEEDLRRVRTYLSEPLGIIASRLDASPSLVADNGVPDLIHKVQLRCTGAQVSITACFDTDFALPPGEIKRGDLHCLYPCSNTLLAVEMTGEEIRDHLEHAAAAFSAYDFSGQPLSDVLPRRAEEYDTLEGIEYELDITRPEGDRVVGLSYRDRPLRKDALLKVALNSDRRAGAGGYPDVSSVPVVYDRQQDVRSLLADYVRQFGLVQCEATENWRLVPDYLGHWARQQVDFLYREELVQGRRGVFGPDNAVETRDVAAWLAGIVLGDADDAGRFKPSADSLGLSWDEHPRRLDALRLVFACVNPDTADWQRFDGRFADWETLSPSDQLVVGTALARGWLVGVPWAVADTAASLTRGEAASVAFSTRFRTVTFIATNDLHGGIEPRLTKGPEPTEVGGIARIAGVVDSLRWRNPGAVIVLDVGDLMQATLISNAFLGRPVVEAYNMIGYDALAVGNHEFDWGLDVLEERASEARFPFLSANIVQTETGLPPPWLTPSTIVERADLSVGVVGLTTPETPHIVKPKYVEGLSFLDMVPSARNEIAELRAEGADVVVVAAHEGVDLRAGGTIYGPAADLAETLEDVDILFTGHSHTYVDTVIQGCPVVQALCCGQAVAVAEIVYDRTAGQVVSRSAKVITRLDGPSNAALDSLVAYYRGQVAEAGERVVARLAQPLTRESNAAGEMVLGDLIADAQRAATGAQIALMNRGGIRADLPEGDVTWAMLYAVQPFGNQLVVVTLTGAQVKEALEQGVGPGGRAVQVSGLTFGYDPAAPRGSRVREVRLEDGEPLDPEGVYSVVVNDFMWGGGDQFAVFKDAQTAEETYTVDIEAFVDHVSSLPQPVTYELQNRIHLAE